MANKKKIFIIGGAVIVFVIFIVLAIVKNQEKLIPVTVEKVERGKIVSIVTANGKVEAKTKVNVSADVMGKIVKLPVVEGQHVKRGQLLVEIDKTQSAADAAQARAALVQSKVGLEDAQINFDRQEKLFKRRLISQAEYDAARINLERARAIVAQSQAGLNRALDRLEKCTIRSPIAGTITTLNSEVGENVIVGTMNNFGTVIMVVSDLSEIEVKADIDETDIARLKLGQDVKISLDAFSDTTFKGKVTEIGNAAKSAGGLTDQVINFEVSILITDTIPGIKPGMNATVDITTDVREDAIKVPIQAVVMRNPAKEKKNKLTGKADTGKKADSASISGGTNGVPDKDINGVFVVEDKTARFVPVKTGISDQQYIEIISGLETGQIVVTGSYKTLRTLRDGDKVKAKEKKFGELTSD